MEYHGGKIAVGLFCLVVVWIIVFWLWTPTEGKISFGAADGPKAELVSDVPPERPKLPHAVAEPSPGPTRLPQESAPQIRPAPRAPSGGVIAPEFDEYTVQPDDTFASIALKFFGSRARADIIAKANPLMDPKRIKPGRVIRIPRDPANIQGKPTTVAPSERVEAASAERGRAHTVVAGDTLTGISRKYYGTIRRVDLILSANRNVLNKAEDLRPGQVLQIPPAPQ
ncbi:MAG: LysM peptidoglycan-binding domain-containing protein [Phycisphaerae bacterium]|nr:LysM peptidoglycan-binding domain-containing protein [Phycisphaerae bacterium]MBN8596661.1 LysM peptidoglycan-binding domain-containing protein [Planctomycetota bacterium]